MYKNKTKQKNNIKKKPKKLELGKGHKSIQLVINFNPHDNTSQALFFSFHK